MRTTRPLSCRLDRNAHHTETVRGPGLSGTSLAHRLHRFGVLYIAFDSHESDNPGLTFPLESGGWGLPTAH